MFNLLRSQIQTLTLLKVFKSLVYYFMYYLIWHLFHYLLFLLLIVQNKGLLWHCPTCILCTSVILIFYTLLSSLLPPLIDFFFHQIVHCLLSCLKKYRFYIWKKTCNVCLSESGLFYSEWCKTSPHFLYPFICWRAPRLIPWLGYCE
jgi:hypothetical protein